MSMRRSGLGGRFRLEVETLENRLVPATVLDLTTDGSAGAIGAALFEQCDAQPTGTGFIRSVVRLQTNAPFEQGYNTSARPLEFNENNSPQFTRSLQLGDVPLVSRGGVLYREFLCDINQKASGASSLLSLDELRLYVAGSPALTGYDSATKQLGGEDPVYDMDEEGDNWVKLDYRLNHGSGSGDIFVLIPALAFGTDNSQFVYIFSAFGTNHAANAGFEEWAVRAVPNPDEPPPVDLSSLSGFVYHDVDNDGIREAGESGIGGVTIMLTGFNDVGANVVLVATTNSAGFYRFANLRPGVYTLLETQPSGFEDGIDTIGTQGGQTENDRFFAIFLAAGVDGEDNNFGELLFGGS